MEHQDGAPDARADSTSLSGEQGGRDVRAWRRAERTRLLDLRQSFPSEQRREWGERIAKTLHQQIHQAGGTVVSAYWPIRGEPELRPLLKLLAREGIRTALPVVVEKNRPMVFREWRSGDRLKRGIWKIPVPAEGAVVQPDVIIAPVVGFDRAGYRLGYGGGYFDRTLATFESAPLVLGIGYAFASLDTIHPQPFDIRMSRIITDEGIVATE